MAESNARRLLAHLASTGRPYAEGGYRYTDIAVMPFDDPVHPSSDQHLVLRMRVRQGNQSGPIIFDSYDPAEKEFDYLYIVNPRTHIDDGLDENEEPINRREDLTAVVRRELRRFVDRKLGNA